MPPKVLLKSVLTWSRPYYIIYEFLVKLNIYFAQYFVEWSLHHILQKLRPSHDHIWILVIS